MLPQRFGVSSLLISRVRKYPMSEVILILTAIQESLSSILSSTINALCHVYNV